MTTSAPIASPSIARFLAIPFTTATIWVVLEWLFFTTKPSFMSLYSATESVGVLASMSLIMSAALLLACLPFALLGWFLGNHQIPKPVTTVVGLLPALLLAALVMLVVIDNFTLTVFGWGVRNATGSLILAYRALTVGLLMWAAWILQGFLFGRYSSGLSRALLLAALLLSLISVPLFFMATAGSKNLAIDLPGERRNLPNIMILTGDGLSANHMSLYGYERPTTPFMDGIQNEFLIAENHFTNASDTGGSVISMLSGKLPTTTRVIYPPDALRGSDSFQHLPGILRQLGYYNADISIRHYADPYDLNMRKGFAEANFRKLSASGGQLLTILRQQPGLNATSQLADRIMERVLERFMHIWNNQPMRDPMAEVDLPEQRWVRDSERMAEITRLIGEAPRPFFVNVHTMGTHGKFFKPTERIWSSEEDYEKLWNIDGYDDAILDFDRMVEQIYGLLKAAGALDETIVVISSDHGFRHGVTQRLPLLIRLPGTSKTGRIGGNSQRLDIAPTLLDALGIAPRDWMEGESLLNPEFDGTNRFIFATGTVEDRTLEGKVWSVTSPQPPWYTLGRLTLVHCDQAFVLTLVGMSVKEHGVIGSTLACDEQLSPEAAVEVMEKHLNDRGY